MFRQYQRVFGQLGVSDVRELRITSRCDAMEPRRADVLEGATGVFFTGGDQLKITSELGDTPVLDRMQAIYEAGGVISGTSAGASAMCETMLVRGSGRESHRLGDVRMAAGLGLIHNAIVDQHFAERGRMGRLLGAVAQNPRMLGIGIDEDTAIVVEEERSFYVLGSGAVYVLDGSGVTYSNVAEDEPDTTLSLYGVTLHVLSHGDQFDFRGRRPSRVGREAVEEPRPQEATAEAAKD